MYGSYSRFVLDGCTRRYEHSERIAKFIKSDHGGAIAADDAAKIWKQHDIELAVELRYIHPEVRGATSYYVAN